MSFRAFFSSCASATVLEAASFPTLTTLVPFFAGIGPGFTLVFLPLASLETRTPAFCFETAVSR